MRATAARSGHQLENHPGVLDAGVLAVEAEVAVGQPLLAEARQGHAKEKETFQLFYKGLITNAA